MTSATPLPPSQPQAPAGSRRLLPFAVVAIFAGLWMLLGAAGLPVPEMGRHWPLIVLLGGVASLADFALFGRRGSSAVLGVIAIGLGAFFYTFTAGEHTLRDLGAWWPWLPAICGAALLAGWVVGRAANPVMFALAAVATGIALSGWGAGRWPMQLVWGGVLVSVGLVFLWRVVARRA